jgi:outer membrane beta-barrel protein
VLFTLLTSVTFAQDAIDIGLLKHSDLRVVQKLVYTKTGKKEMGAHAGLMPFDAFTMTPKIDLSYGQHLSEELGWEVTLGGGYGLKNGTFRRLEGPAYAIAPDAYRYLGSVVADVQYSPVYAKLSWTGKEIYHHDLYGLLGGGVSIEQAFLPDKDLSIAPTIAIGVGARVFLTQSSTLRLQLRDDLLLQSREKTVETQSLYLKQNFALTVGYTLLQK